MRTFNELIDAFGVPTLVKLLRIPDTHVRTLKARDSVPTEYWPKLIEAAPKHDIQGIDYPALLRMRDRRLKRGRAA